MSITEFIKEQATARAIAASALTVELKINGIEISAGCDKNGIEVPLGLDKLADILGVEIKTVETPVSYDPRSIEQTEYIEYNGSKFYKKHFIRKEDTENEG